MNKELKINQEIFFIGENLPYKVMSTSNRYCVVSRKLNKKEDRGLLDFRVEMNAYSSFSEAYNHLKDSPVYSLLDFQENYRAPSNLIFDHFNYFDHNDCNEVIKWLESGDMKLSYRNKISLNIDWDRIK